MTDDLDYLREKVRLLERIAELERELAAARAYIPKDNPGIRYYGPYIIPDGRSTGDPLPPNPVTICSWTTNRT